MLKKFLLLFQKLKYKKLKIELKKGVNFRKTIFEGCGKFGDNSNIRSSFIGFGTYVGKNCDLSYSRIGRFCSIGNDVKIIVGDHPIYNYVSSHPVFHSDILKEQGLFFKNYVFYDGIKKLEKISGGGVEIRNFIGNDVWIGSNVSILAGIKIGNGAVIGTGAVVVKDVEPYSVVVGVPAKEIKKRFTDEKISFLEKFEWWNKDINWLEKNVVLFSDINSFIKKIKEN